MTSSRLYVLQSRHSPHGSLETPNCESVQVQIEGSAAYSANSNEALYFSEHSYRFCSHKYALVDSQQLVTELCARPRELLGSCCYQQGSVSFPRCTSSVSERITSIFHVFCPESLHGGLLKQSPALESQGPLLSVRTRRVLLDYDTFSGQRCTEPYLLNDVDGRRCGAKAATQPAINYIDRYFVKTHLSLHIYFAQRTTNIFELLNFCDK